MSNTEPAPETTAFLSELCKRTKGSTTAQASMYEVGAAVGLARNDAGKLAETLIGQGLIDIRTLSGGIGLTESGLEAARASGGDPAAPGEAALGSQRLLTPEARKTVEAVSADFKKTLATLNLPYERLDEAVLDLKTIEVHLLSPAPKTAVVREVLRSLRDLARIAKQVDMVRRLDAIIG